MRPFLLLCVVWCCGVLAGCDDKSVENPPPPPPPPDGPIIYVPDEAATFRVALELAEDGDTILFADGIYSGDGNRDVVIPDLELVIMSVSGPAATVFDCEGDLSEYHFALSFDNVKSSVVVDGFTFRGTYDSHGAVRCRSASPIFVNCVFADNHATISGGALRCKSGSPVIRNCTFTRNGSMAGGGMFLIAGASPIIQNCIISHSPAGGAVYSSDGTSVPVMSCCDVFGNVGGDWVDHIEDQAGINGNLSANPLFCDLAGGDLRLQLDSPCAEINNECGELIGAGEVGCP